MVIGDDGNVVLGTFGGKLTLDHLLKQIKEEAKEGDPVLIFYTTKDGRVKPVSLDTTVDDFCYMGKLLDVIISDCLREDMGQDEE